MKMIVLTLSEIKSGCLCKYCGRPADMKLLGNGPDGVDGVAYICRLHVKELPKEEVCCCDECGTPNGNLSPIEKLFSNGSSRNLNVCSECVNNIEVDNAEIIRRNSGEECVEDILYDLTAPDEFKEDESFSIPDELEGLFDDPEKDE